MSLTILQVAQMGRKYDSLRSPKPSVKGPFEIPDEDMPELMVVRVELKRIGPFKDYMSDKYPVSGETCWNAYKRKSVEIHN